MQHDRLAPIREEAEAYRRAADEGERLLAVRSALRDAAPHGVTASTKLAATGTDGSVSSIGEARARRAAR